MFFASLGHKIQEQAHFKTVRLQTHLPFHIKSKAEEQRKIEAHFHDIIPVLRWQHGLHGHITHTYKCLLYCIL